MAKCGYCGSTIIMGGVKQGDQRFCNQKCFQNGYVLAVAKNLPADVVEREVEQIFRGNCPVCQGTGPVDVHKIHRVWSALVLTSWSSSQKVCCRSCATKSQAGGALFSAVLGWWGFPWGIVLTPVQIARNIMGMCSGESSQPSADLRRLVQAILGARMLQAGAQQSAGAPPVIPHRS